MKKIKLVPWPITVHLERSPSREITAEEHLSHAKDKWENEVLREGNSLSFIKAAVDVIETCCRDAGIERSAIIDEEILHQACRAGCLVQARNYLEYARQSCNAAHNIDKLHEVLGEYGYSLTDANISQDDIVAAVKKSCQLTWRAAKISSLFLFNSSFQHLDKALATVSLNRHDVGIYWYNYYIFKALACFRTYILRRRI